MNVRAGPLLYLALLVACLASQAAGLSTMLIHAIKKKDDATAISELQKEDVDANESRAYVTVKEPGTGNSALHYAIKGDSVDIAKLLLSYGSNPDAEDKKGVQARKLATSKGMKQLLATFDQKGALAFEDAPGTWVKSVSESGAKFWYNRATKEARWNKPPSAAWQRLLHQGHPTSYYNEVTGQRVHTIPPALSWRKLAKEEGEGPFWYNWVSNESTLETPAELPDDMVTEAESNMFNVRWYHKVTGEVSWTNPKYMTSWREMADEGIPFYYNVETGETVRDAPEEFAWERQWRLESNNFV